MNYLDLFSGIGGFHLGLVEAGFKFDWVGFSEIDKYAKQIYQKHFIESEDLGDVRTIELNRLPKVDLITFGFPCQDVSIAGKRGGLSASRSSLFFEAMQIIGITKPNYFIFENVKGLFSSNEGRDWLTILREITNSGYDSQWQLLNTRWFLPQNRERIYFIGHIRGERRPEIFPIEENGGLDNKTCQKDKQKIYNYRCLEGTEYKGISSERFDGIFQDRKNLIQINKNINQEQSLYVMKWQRSEKGKGIRKENYKKGKDYTPFSDGCRELVEKKENIIGTITNALNKDTLIKIGNKNPSGKGQSGNVYDINGISPTITSGGKNPNRDRDIGPNFGYIEDDLNIRRLTPIECERLQGFPDNWTKEGISGNTISDTQRYKCLGNAVSIPVVKEIGIRLLKCLI